MASMGDVNACIEGQLPSAFPALPLTHPLYFSTIPTMGIISEKQTIRLATWNMGFWEHKKAHEEAWHWLLDELRPDIALCQECILPDWARQTRTVIWDRAYPERERQPWGTALVTHLPAKPTRFPELDAWIDQLPKRDANNELAFVHRADGWLSAAEVDLPLIGKTHIISVHSPAYEIPADWLKGIDISAIRLKLNKDIWLLDVLFYFLRNRLGSQLIVGGDFNYSRLLDDPRKPSGNNEFFDRIAQEGFVSLHRKFHSADEQTFFKEGKREHQLDYLYADSPVARHAVSCKVVPNADLKEMSDHAPLVAEFRFESGPDTPQ